MNKTKEEKQTNYSEPNGPLEKLKERRRTVITLVCIVLFAIGGICAMFALLMKATHRDPGYYKVEASQNDGAPLYSHNYAFEHYFEGESLQIKFAIDACAKKYSEILLRIYKLTDAQNQYADCKNIAYLNANQGKEIELDEELFDILVSAYELTQSGRFNMFAGALDSAWNEIIYSNAPEEFDPLVNAEQKARIAAAVECTKSLADFTFEVVDADKHVVRFETADAYKSFSQANDFSASVIDLGYLRDAFVIDTVCRLMEYEGYDNGYMSSVSGAVKALSGMKAQGHEFVAYGLINSDAVRAYSLPMLEGSACCCLRAFGLENEIGYYTVETENGRILRHPNYSVNSGEMHDEFISVCAYAQKGSAVEVSLAAQNCIAADLNSASSDAGIHVSYIKKSEPMKVFADPAVKDKLKPLDEWGYTIG